MAAAAIVACNKAEVVESPQNAAIEFDNVFVDNATKAADITASNLESFGVYGTVAKGGQNGLIFENEEVTKNGTAYTYSPAQYWVPSAAYTFTAIAPYQTGANATWTYDPATAKISFHNDVAQANQDLVFAYAEKTTEASIAQKPEAVQFTFNHQLARAKFTFANGFGEDSNIRLVVRNVTITNVHKSGTLAVTVNEGNAVTAWEALADNTKAENIFARVFNTDATALTIDADTNDGGAVSAATEHFYLIPSDSAFNVTFDVDIYQAGVKIATYPRTATLQYDMKIGYSYDIKATLTTQNTTGSSEIYPIEFNVSGVNDWANSGQFTDVNATVNQ